MANTPQPSSSINLTRKKGSQVYIPLELVHYIFSYLPGNQVGKVMTICREWYDLLDSSDAWAERFKIEFLNNDKKEQELKDKQLEIESAAIFPTVIFRKRSNKRNAPFKELPAFMSYKKRYRIRYFYAIKKCYVCNVKCRARNVIDETKMCLCDTCFKQEVVNVTNLKKRFCIKPAEIKQLTRYQSFGYLVAEVERYFDENFEGGLLEELDRRRDKRDKRVSSHMNGRLSNQSQLKELLRENLESQAIIPRNKIGKLVESWTWQHGAASKLELQLNEAITVLTSQYKNKMWIYDHFKEVHGTYPSSEERAIIKRRLNWIIRSQNTMDVHQEEIDRVFELILSKNKKRAAINEAIEKNLGISMDSLPTHTRQRVQQFLQLYQIQDEEEYEHMYFFPIAQRREDNNNFDADLQKFIGVLADEYSREKVFEKAVADSGQSYKQCFLPDALIEYYKYGFTKQTFEELLKEVLTQNPYKRAEFYDYKDETKDLLRRLSEEERELILHKTVHDALIADVPELQAREKALIAKEIICSHVNATYNAKRFVIDNFILKGEQEKKTPVKEKVQDKKDKKKKEKKSKEKKPKAQEKKKRKRRDEEEEEEEEENVEEEEEMAVDNADEEEEELTISQRLKKRARKSYSKKNKEEVEADD